MSGQLACNKYLFSRQRVFSPKSDCVLKVEIAEIGVYL